jgi:PAS domain-containing protein
MAAFDLLTDSSNGWLLDALSDGVLLLDPEWRVVSANVAAERLWSRSRGGGARFGWCCREHGRITSYELRITNGPG